MIATIQTDLFDEIVGNSLADTRPYQKRICSKVFDLFTEGDDPFKSIMIESPTGSGKTLMGLVLARMLYERHGWRCAWVTMNRELRRQAAAEMQKMNLDVPGIRFISMFDRDPPRDVDILLHDEGQHDAAASAANLHNILQPQRIIGMTATPYRTDRVKLCFEKVIKDIGIAQLIKQEYLSPYNHFTIPDWQVTTVCEVYRKMRDRWGPSFMFFLTTDQCNAAKDYLQAYGITDVEVITGQTDREQQIDDFKSGKVSLLIGMKVIAEGIDCPMLKTVFVRDSQRGPTIQMCGRVFRKHPDISHKQIVQSHKTRWPFPRTALPVEQWLLTDGQWRSVLLNPHLNRIAANTMRMMAHAKVEMPDYLIHKAKKKRWSPPSQD